MFLGQKLFPAVFLLTLVIVVDVGAKKNEKTTKLPFKLPRYDDNDRRHNILDIKMKDTDEWLFKDFLKKFRPINVWERLYQKQKAQGLNTSLAYNIKEIMKALDETDVILRIKLRNETNGQNRQVKQDGRRQKWSPPVRLDLDNYADLFSIRRRFYELILHTMYWTRNKMTIMQTYRKRYQRSKIYKMGFMMSKNDIQCKMFHRYAFRVVSTCLRAGRKKQNRYYPIEMLHAEERLMNKWMDITLLTELIERNDETCKEMLEIVSRNREQAWLFYD